MKLVITYRPPSLTRDSTSLSKPLTGSKQAEITLVAIPLSLPVASKVHSDKSKSIIQHYFSLASMCRSLDTGLVLVMFMTLSMVLTLACLLSLVKYEACPVLLKNNTVSMMINKNDESRNVDII